MKKFLFSTVVVASLAVSSQAEVNLKDISLGADIGTTGYGVTAVKKLSGFDDKWGVRVGYHQYSKTYNKTSDNTKYKFDLDLGDIQLMADYHPWNTAFKLTFGAMYNGNELDGKITPNSASQIIIDGTPYTSTDLGGVDVKVDFDNTIAPYVGIGWDTSFYKPNKTWGFTFNLGVAYLGSAKVSYSPKYGSVSSAIIDAKLEKEKASLQDDLDDFKYLPFISIGFNYKF